MLKPLYDHVILKKKEASKTTASGIILTTSTKEAPAIAEVVAVGSGKVVDGKNVGLIVKEGDIVVYREYAGVKVDYQGEEYLIVKEEDILATVE